MINSKQKGNRGEREFANYLKKKGIFARRGQQYSGSPDSPDVVTELKDYHFEVKRVERLELYKAMEQAEADKGQNQIPIVAYRKNNKEWVAIVKMDDLIFLIKEIKEYEYCWDNRIIRE